LQECYDEKNYTSYSYCAHIISPFDELVKIKLSENKDSIHHGYIFYSFVSMENDEEILKQHGRIEVCSFEDLPQITKHEWQGVWTPVDINPKGIKDGLSDGKKITLSSQTGVIPEDGGDYLIFVLFMKKIINSGFTLKQKKEWVDVGYRTRGQSGVGFENYLNLIGPDIESVMRKI